ncbi:Conserved oligomeric Golgi complex subunit 5 [Cryptosporidium felis]|nr:Conserved oligomeric Golgi complex subunit 5 [Cryptosporidium felis]
MDAQADTENVGDGYSEIIPKNGGSCEELTNKLIKELADPSLFIRSCILRGSKQISKCIYSFDIAISHVNNQLEKQIFQLAQMNSVKNLCQDFEQLKMGSKLILDSFSTCRCLTEKYYLPIIQQYDQIKDNITISKRILDIQNLCNRTLEFISLISRLKTYFGITKNANNENQSNNYPQLQNEILESIDINKTSKIIVELEKMIGSDGINSEETANYKGESPKEFSLEFIEILDEDIKWLRKISAVYRQNGHKKLLKGIEEMDKNAIFSGCVILYKFGELWEHVYILVEDILLKRVYSAFQVCTLQKCIDKGDRFDGLYSVSFNFATVSILFVIENALNQVIIGLKQLICLYDTIVESNAINNQYINEMNFINVFWEKSLSILETTFNNIYSINSKVTNLQPESGKEIVVSGSLKLEQILYLLIYCYPEILKIFNSTLKNVRTLLSTSSSRAMTTVIVNENKLFESVSNIKEMYFESIKEIFNLSFESIIPKKVSSIGEHRILSEMVSRIIQSAISEMQRTKTNKGAFTKVYEIFKKELLCFMVQCETVIQPEGGIINYSEEINRIHSNGIVDTDQFINKVPKPTNLHVNNAKVSLIVALLSDELRKIYKKEILANLNTTEKDEVVELLKSLQYKSTGRWFSQTSFRIFEFSIRYQAANKEKIGSESSKLHPGQEFITNSQEVINNFIQEWIPLLVQQNLWSKCYFLLCRNIIIIFLVNFSLREDLTEANCFEIAEHIVSLQSIISHFSSEPVVKNQLTQDLKIVQNFRRILFSDFNVILEAIQIISSHKKRDTNNIEILCNSINEINHIILTVHLLNRIYHTITKKVDISIPNLSEHSGISSSKLSSLLAHNLYVQLNDYTVGDSDSDLIVIFEIFKQSISSEYIHDQSLLNSKIKEYIHLIIETISFGVHSIEISNDIENLKQILEYLIKKL